MSVNTILVVVGAVLILVGLAKAAQSGGLGLSNIGINFGSTNTQTNKVGNVTPVTTKGGKADWVGLGIAAIGLADCRRGAVQGLGQRCPFSIICQRWQHQPPDNIVGITPEQLAALIRRHEDHSEIQKKLIARLETDLDLNERQMREALHLFLGGNDVPDEQLGVKLVEIAGHFENLRSGASTDPGDSPVIVALKSDVQRAIDAGELAKADALLEDIAIEQRHSVERSAINLAGTLARRAEIALTRLRYREATGHFTSAAAMLPTGIDYDDKRASYVMSEGYALYRQGLEFGDNAALLSAIERFQRSVRLRPASASRSSGQRAGAIFGAALQTLGEREGGTSPLEEAVAAYRAALEERTRARVPLDWAATQNNLGTALSRLGTQEGGRVAS